MSGGVAYVLDESGDFGRYRCNLEMVELEVVTAPDDIAELRQIIEKHYRYTGSAVARRVLDSIAGPRLVTAHGASWKTGARYWINSSKSWRWITKEHWRKWRMMKKEVIRYRLLVNSLKICNLFEF